MIREKIRQAALAAGFHAVGFVSYESLAEGDLRMEGWVRAGKHAGMKYLEDFRRRRNDLLCEMPNPKTLILLGVNYFHPHTDETDTNGEKLTGRIARYAWGRDYHFVIQNMHQVLIAQLKMELEETRSAKFISCVDIQPVPEKFAAVKAGLGFQGKHTVLLSRKYGPWLFLSALLTDLGMVPDTPDGGHCGTCSDCQPACPTGALSKDYVLDANLCIAYLTIEHKGIIPRLIRPKIKNWVFGCDECLNVCPFAAKKIPDGHSAFKPESGPGASLELAELFEIRSNAEYRKKFSGTALLRTTRKQLLRNACIVLGNTRSVRVIPLLEKGLRDRAPLVRIHAAWALSQIPGNAAAKILQSYLLIEKTPEVLAEIQAGLAL